jgi:hypothetical protein
MNVKALKFHGVKAAVDVYLGEDQRGISILDRVIGVVERLKNKPVAVAGAEDVYPTRTHVMRDAVKEVDKLDAMSLSDGEILLALDVAGILLWEDY